MYDIPLVRPYITQEVKDRVNQVLDSRFLTEGSVTRSFENLVRDFIGCKHALAVTSCTTGLEIALRALNIGEGDEVIIPDYTFPATADAILITGATAVIVDVSPETMLIDYDAIDQAITPATKAIMPVSIFGTPLDYDKLNALKEKHGFFIIEDAACSLGSAYKDKKTGNLADITVFSFHPRKFITSGEGGMVTTNDSEWYTWMHSYKHFGVGLPTPRRSAAFDQVGTNYKMSDILAAVGEVQMLHIDTLLDNNMSLAESYKGLLEGSGVPIQEAPIGGVQSWQSFCLLIEKRDHVLTEMRRLGIEVQIGTYALHLQPAFQHNPKCVLPKQELSGSLKCFQESLVLPIYYGLDGSQQQQVVKNLMELLS